MRAAPDAAVAVHRHAGVGSAADFMARLLWQVVPEDWQRGYEGRTWRAWPPGDLGVGVSVQALSRHGSFTVYGWAPRVDEVQGYGLAAQFKMSPHGFTAGQADGILVALQAVGVLPERVGG